MRCDICFLTSPCTSVCFVSAAGLGGSIAVCTARQVVVVCGCARRCSVRCVGRVTTPPLPRTPPLSPPRAAVRAPGGGAAVRLEEERQRVKCAEAADLLRRKKEAGVLVAEEERLEMPQEGMLVVRGQREGS